MTNICSHCMTEKNFFDIFVVSDGIAQPFCDWNCLTEYIKEMEEICNEKEEESQETKPND